MGNLGEELPMFIVTDEFIQDLRDLGYESMELDDLLDILEVDDMYWETV